MDPNQPMIKNLTLSRKFKSYVGLKNAEEKLKKWLTDYDFIDLSTANLKIDWNLVNRIKL
jgi:hypothetical protein